MRSGCGRFTIPTPASSSPTMGWRATACITAWRSEFSCTGLFAGKPAPTGAAQNSGIVRSLWELTCRRWAAKQPLCHYSNAGIKQPNDGVESYSLHYRMAL
ncbi:acyloxyacyl hydrolase [Pseudomonas sp. 10-1B]|uniref:acyloxyacyl hydrolase n=1 Tax=Pseudomonas sp. 10-1B TaxID=1546029 RepID=UPI0009E37492